MSDGRADREVNLPTEEELRMLPRWARVAFAARCAERVRPLFKHFWPEASEEHVQAVDRACMLAKAAAANPAIARNAHADAANAAKAAENADDARDDAARTYALTAAANAASAAANAVTPVDSRAATNAANAAASARISHADARVPNPAARADDDAARAAMRSDFDLLRTLSQGHLGRDDERLAPWTDETPVNPDLLGPLWPFGEPEGWPIQSESDEPVPAMKFEIAIPAGLSEAESKAFDEKIVQLLAAMSKMHAEMGGTGLRILDECSFESLPADDPESHHATQPAGCGGAL